MPTFVSQFYKDVLEVGELAKLGIYNRYFIYKYKTTYLHSLIPLIICSDLKMTEIWLGRINIDCSVAKSRLIAVDTNEVIFHFIYQLALYICRGKRNKLFLLAQM